MLRCPRDRVNSSVLGDREATEQLRELEELLAHTQTVITDKYRQVWLVRPERGTLKRGAWTFDVWRLAGPSTTFQRSTVKTPVGLDVEKLYLIEPGAEQPLELLPFVRVMASPETEANACYFFNRVDSEGTRWISYHFDAESSTHTTPADFQEIADRLRRPAIPDGDHDDTHSA